MAKAPASNSKSIQKTDVLSSAVITSLATFILLTWSKSIPAEAAISPYVNEQLISVVAGIISVTLTLIFSLFRYEIKLKMHERDYTKKVKYLDQIISITTCESSKEQLETQKNTLLKDAAKAIVDEKL